MQFAFVLDRTPRDILRRGDDLAGMPDIVERRTHCFHDWQNLVGVNAPHAHEAEFVARSQGVISHHIHVTYFSRYVVRRNDAIAKRRRGNFTLGARD